MKITKWLGTMLSLCLLLTPAGSATSAKPDGEKTAEVLNLPPIGDFSAQHYEPLDLNFVIRDTDRVSEAQLSDKINTLVKQPLAANGIVPNVRITQPTMVYQGKVYDGSSFIKPDGSYWTLSSNMYTYSNISTVSRVSSPIPMSELYTAPFKLLLGKDKTLWSSNPNLTYNIPQLLASYKRIKKIIGSASHYLCMFEDGSTAYLDQKTFNDPFTIRATSFPAMKDVFDLSAGSSRFYGLLETGEFYKYDQFYGNSKLLDNVKHVSVDGRGTYIAILNDKTVMFGGGWYTRRYPAGSSATPFTRDIPPTKASGITTAEFGEYIQYYNNTNDDTNCGTILGSVVLDDRSTIAYVSYSTCVYNNDRWTFQTNNVKQNFVIKEKKKNNRVVLDENNNVRLLANTNRYPDYNLLGPVTDYWLVGDRIVVRKPDGSLLAAKAFDQDWVFVAQTSDPSGLFSPFQPIREGTSTGPGFNVNGPGPSDLPDALNKIDLSSSSKKVVVDFSDGAFPELADPQRATALQQGLAANDLTLVGMGNAGNQAYYQQVIAQNQGKGTFINSDNIDQALRQLTDYLVQRYSPLKWGPGSTHYALLGEMISMKPGYIDPENDAWGATLWKFTQGPNYFENPTGAILNNGSWVGGTLGPFSQVGKYDISVKVRDKPTPNPNFANDYWLWSNPSSNMTLLVHRKPCAVFVATADQAGSNGNRLISLIDQSYDLDHYSRSDRGILRTDWSWMNEADGLWKMGVPVDIPPNATYRIRLRVQDVEGQWSDYNMQTIINDNNDPPLMTITNPSGTALSPNVFNTDPLIQWDYQDRENEAQRGYILQFEYADDGTPALTVQQDKPDQQYQIAVATLKRGRLIKVSGFVYDGEWSSRSNSTYFMIGQPKVTLSGAPLQLYAGESATLLAAGQYLTNWQYIFISDKQVANTLAGGSTSLYSDYRMGASSNTTTALSGAQRTVQYLASVYDTRQNTTITSSNQVTINWLALPRVAISTTPAMIYEGDTLTVQVTPQDDNGYADNLVVQKQQADGSWSTIWSKQNVPAYAMQTFPLSAPITGTYQLRSLLTDPNGRTASAQTSYTVAPLIVTGQVVHTNEWEQNRQNWNSRGRAFRDIDVFWAGESFVVMADTTDTGTATKASSVKVEIIGLGNTATLSPSTSKKTTWSGTLWETDFEKLADQTLTFRFTALWSNGTQKTHDVDVIVSGSVYDYYRLHRRY